MRRRDAREHHRVPVAFRILDKLVRLSGMDNVTTASENEIIDGQKRLPRNPLTNFFFGIPAPRADVRTSHFIIEEGELAVRVHRPTSPSAEKTSVLYFHGGGWVGGDAGLSDWWCTRYAAETGALVVSLDYRLAPIHRFPTALLDGYRALCWLSDQQDAFGISADRISVAGDSAGGNLAAALCLYARDQGGPRIAHQVLINPALDLTLSSPSVEENADAPLLSSAALRSYAGHYLGAAQSASNPYASPLLAGDLSMLPPALIQVGEHDPLRDDGWRFARRLEDAGVPVQVIEYPGAPHGFVNFPYLSRIGRQSLRDAIAYASTAGAGIPINQGKFAEGL